MTDGFEQIALDYFGSYQNINENKLFEHAHDDDKLELAVQVAIAESTHEYCGNFRVMPTSMIEEYHDNYNRCCGITDMTWKCSSGREYLIGFDYGH